MVAHCSLRVKMPASVTRAAVLLIPLTLEVVILERELTSPEGAHQQPEDTICATKAP